MQNAHRVGIEFMLLHALYHRGLVIQKSTRTENSKEVTVAASVYDKHHCHRTTSSKIFPHVRAL